MKALLVFLVAACSPMVYVHGVPNLDQVDANVWRSGQIATQEGWDWVAKLAAGRQVHVVKLNFDTEGSDELARAMGFEIDYLPVQPRGDQDLWDDTKSVFIGPDAATIEQAMSVLTHCKLHPESEICIAHCTHGQDRTGYLIGRYRVTDDGWTKDRAYAEMRAHHFHPELHGIHEAWEQFTPAP